MLGRSRPMSEDQGALFGDLDGLFADIEVVPCTPIAEVRLAEGAPRCTGCPWLYLAKHEACPGRYGAACSDRAESEVI